MKEIILTTAAGMVGTFAFAVIYHVKARHLLNTFLGGGLTTFILMSLLSLTDGNNLLSNMAAAFAGGVYCMLCAYHRKAPSTVFLIPTLFPLVPGRNLYFSIIALVRHSRAQFVDNFAAAVEISFGIAVGVLFSSLFDVFVLQPFRAYRTRRSL